MSADDDFHTRARGQQAQQALETLTNAIEVRGEQTLAAAEAAHLAGRLTPEGAYSWLVTLLEQRRLLASLESAVEQGVQAARRIQKSVDAQALVAEQGAVAAAHGHNRLVSFPTRRPPPPKAAS